MIIPGRLIKEIRGNNMQLNFIVCWKKLSHIKEWRSRYRDRIPLPSEAVRWWERVGENKATTLQCCMNVTCSLASLYHLLLTGAGSVICL